MKLKKLIYFICLVIVSFQIDEAAAQDNNKNLQLAVLKYGGGGDWYANPTALPNLARFANQHLKTKISPNFATVEVGSPELFNYPWIFATGHGNIIFTNHEAENLRNYLIGGGFLHIDDNYGFAPFVRLAMKQVFPELDFVELPFTHQIYDQKFRFTRGLPKIHEHDGMPAQGFGLVYEGRLVCFFSFESDLGNGWEDPDVHGDPEHLRQAALQMGANILQYAFTN